MQKEIDKENGNNNNRTITGEFVTDWLEVCIAGTYQQMGWSDEGPCVREVEITPERLKRLVANFKPELREPVVVEGHYPMQQKALAWVADVKAEGGIFYNKLKDLSPIFKTIIANKEYKYFSIGTDFADLTDETTEYYEHLACTNFPLVPGMKNFPDSIAGLHASGSSAKVFTSKINFESFSNGMHLEKTPENLNHKKSMNANLKILASRFSIAIEDTSKEEDVAASVTVALDKVMNENTALKAENGTLKTANTTLQAAKNKIVIDGAIEAGKITEAEKPKWEKLLADSPETTLELLAEKQPTGIFEQNKIQAAKGGIGTGSADDLTLTDKEDYDYLQKNDPVKLEKLQASKLEVFKKLYFNHYKTEYVA